MQERLNSIADALELHLSCTIPLIYGTGNQSWLCGDALARNDTKSSADTMSTTKLDNSLQNFWTRAGFLFLAWSKLRLCSANHRAGYFSNLACDWLSIVWAYSKQETENGPWWCHSKLLTAHDRISRYRVDLQVFILTRILLYMCGYKRLSSLHHHSNTHHLLFQAEPYCTTQTTCAFITAPFPIKHSPDRDHRFCFHQQSVLRYIILNIHHSEHTLYINAILTNANHAGGDNFGLSNLEKHCQLLLHLRYLVSGFSPWALLYKLFHKLDIFHKNACSAVYFNNKSIYVMCMLWWISMLIFRWTFCILDQLVEYLWIFWLR